MKKKSPTSSFFFAENPSRTFGKMSSTENESPANHFLPQTVYKKGKKIEVRSIMDLEEEEEEEEDH